MSQITDLSFSELKQSLDDRTLSSVEITSAFLDRIDDLAVERQSMTSSECVGASVVC